MSYVKNKSTYKFELIIKRKFKNRRPLFESILRTNDLLHIKAVMKSIERHNSLLNISLFSYV